MSKRSCWSCSLLRGFGMKTSVVVWMRQRCFNRVASEVEEDRVCQASQTSVWRTLILTGQSKSTFNFHKVKFFLFLFFTEMEHWKRKHLGWNFWSFSVSFKFLLPESGHFYLSFCFLETKMVLKLGSKFSISAFLSGKDIISYYYCLIHVKITFRS